MPNTTISDNVGSIQFTFDGRVRNIVKAQIDEVVLIKGNTVKLDIGLGALFHIYIPYSDVSEPLTESPEALRDFILAMILSGSGGGGGTATIENQLTIISYLESIYSYCQTINSRTLSNTSTLSFINGRSITTDANVLANKNALTAITSNVDSINTRTLALQETVGTINTSISTLNTTVNSINVAVGSINTRTIAMNDALGTINTSIATINSNISTLNTNINSINAAVGSISPKVTATNDTVAAMNITVGAINSSLTAQGTQIGTINATVNTMNTKLNSLALTVDNLLNPLMIDMSNVEMTYKGYAVIGSAESSPVWAIERITKIGGIETHAWANSAKTFINRWPFRASLTYGAVG